MIIQSISIWSLKPKGLAWILRVFFLGQSNLKLLHKRQKSQFNLRGTVGTVELGINEKFLYTPKLFLRFSYEKHNSCENDGFWDLSVSGVVDVGINFLDRNPALCPTFFWWLSLSEEHNLFWSFLNLLGILIQTIQMIQMF